MNFGRHESQHWEEDDEHIEEGKRIAEAFIREHRMQNEPNVVDMASFRADKTRSMLGRLFH